MKIVEANLVPYDHGQALHGDMSGPHREDMNVKQAKAYLDNYPDGVLCHDYFETDSFVAITKYGIYVFYNSAIDKIQHWNWEKDIADMLSDYDPKDRFAPNPLEGWWYNSGDEQLGFSHGSIEFWDRIRNGHEVPVD